MLTLHYSFDSWVSIMVRISKRMLFCAVNLLWFLLPIRPRSLFPTLMSIATNKYLGIKKEVLCMESILHSVLPAIYGNGR